MQVFTNLQFKLFWALSLFCYVLFIGEAGWGQLEDVNNNLYNGQDTTGTLGRGAPTKTLKELGHQHPTVAPGGLPGVLDERDSNRRSTATNQNSGRAAPVKQPGYGRSGLRSYHS